ncbi:GNAT family N-acetyltransferase [Lewinella sp. 4G2]|uniref:GNAT family N-acetyltransferase n=1 Tax=Lewinella sp. 4G2 TaxID=1803372 RepID=UPI0007B4A6FE|nr:GNAT family N-acetyltransferase [Lewinella sp. 4G2]OAV45390.1 hypothetical protein A3850_013205 [Lewinella sp. 4G2]
MRPQIVLLGRANTVRYARREALLGEDFAFPVWQNEDLLTRWKRTGFPAEVDRLFLVQLPATGALVGTILMTRVRKLEYEVAYGIQPTWRRNGLATKGVGLALRSMSEELKQSIRVFAHVSAENTASVRVLQAHEFVQVLPTNNYGLQRWELELTPSPISTGNS